MIRGTLAAVRRVEVGAPRTPAGFRSPGTYFPGVIAAGTYRSRGGKDFWDVRDPAGSLVIDLEGADYRRLVVEVEDPERTAAEIRAEIR
ncbi:hypothetical protein ABGB12_18280 [Actinocorallia sp. B10E7]|uniref:hypothetical protein n=1 Tax=Actinocorallia sp. B10E7 TaxID=3153558 RepID=UPI00325F8114